MQFLGEEGFPTTCFLKLPQDETNIQ